MRRFLKGMSMAFTMFSAIPMPHCWDDKATPFIIPSLPLVGGMIGGLWFGLSLLLAELGLPIMLSAALLFIFPMLISGFIHVDGLMDCSDAIGSRAELSRKREILKDSHVGAFAVISFGCYLLVGFAAVYSVMEAGTTTIVFVFIPVLSRSLVGTLLLNVRLISSSGFGATFRQGTTAIHTAVVVCFGIASLALGYLLGGYTALLPLLALVLGGLLGAAYAVKQLDGISGDLCGFVITISELCALVALAAV